MLEDYCNENAKERKQNPSFKWYLVSREYVPHMHLTSLCHLSGTRNQIVSLHLPLEISWQYIESIPAAPPVWLFHRCSYRLCRQSFWEKRQYHIGSQHQDKQRNYASLPQFLYAFFWSHGTKFLSIIFSEERIVIKCRIM